MRLLFAGIFCCSLFASAAVIKPGNVIEITVQEYPTYSGRFIVSAEGTIEYPLLPSAVVANLSTAELVNELTYKLAKLVNNPLVSVTIIEKPEITVKVLGQVIKPGPVLTYTGSTIQEVLQLAGGPLPQSDLSRIKIVRKNASDENAEYYDLNNFLKNGNVDNMPVLNADDAVIVLSEERNRKVKVIGAVVKPGFYDIEGKINIFELIYLTGGPAEKADLSRIRRFFRHEDKTMEEVVNVQSYLDKGKMDDIPVVGEGDVIIVYARWFDWMTMLTILNNALLFVVTIQSLRGALGNK
jgi:protein involved in polysaccharide export with SLBB domain